MTFQLTPRIQAQIEEIAALGDYSDRDDIIEVALDLLIEQEKARALREKLQAADDQYLTGEYEEFSRERFVQIREEALAQFRNGERVPENARW